MVADEHGLELAVLREDLQAAIFSRQGSRRGTGTSGAVFVTFRTSLPLLRVTCPS
jgi:hypothetical protein